MAAQPLFFCIVYLAADFGGDEMKYYVMGTDERFEILKTMLTCAPEDEADMIVPTPTAKLHGANIVNYASDEEYLTRNADITAEGAVWLLMRELDRTISGRNVTVVGSGRIAKLLAEKLNALGASVTVACRSERERAMFAILGMNAAPLENIGGTIIINTVPERVVDLDNLRKGALLIELASKPGGFDQEEAEKRGMRVVAAPGLPAKYAPRSAAEAIAAFIRKGERAKP